MTGFVTQTEWAQDLGVSVRTFRRWREAGFIPLPDGAMPGRPRWSVALVEKTRLTLPLRLRGFARRSQRQQRVLQSHASRFQQSSRSLHGAGVSGELIGKSHGESVGDDANQPLVHSLDGAR